MNDSFYQIRMIGSIISSISSIILGIVNAIYAPANIKALSAGFFILSIISAAYALHMYKEYKKNKHEDEDKK